ncbi:MAG: hypothetical protein DWQ04_33775 [Chloroflexi bacterium]|nr:MAG: hypothetical protein DWQ04_33775 [Chloroflexota bacterium]
MGQQQKDNWVELVKQALKSWHQSVVLGQNRLAHLNIVAKQQQEKGYAADSLGAAQALRDLLRKGILALGIPNQPTPEGESDPAWMDPSWRAYSILTLRFLRGFSRTEIQHRIGMAEGGQYYEAQRKAIVMLAALLREWEGDPEDETPPITLEYPSGAVKLSEPYYIERQSDHDLSYEIVHPGRTITMTGPRQVGKTSLLIRAVHAAKKAHDAQVVYLDLQTVSRDALADQSRFFQELAYLIADELNLELDVVDKAWASRLAPGRKLTKLMERVVLAGNERPLILALDEVDRLLLTSYHADFFGLLRSWHNMRSRSLRWEQFSLLMAISTEPYLLIDDMQQSPFNVGLMLYLDDFSEEQVAELNGRYQSPIPHSQIPTLHQLLNGHPYLTRVAFYTMVKDGLTMDALLKTADTDTSPFAPHLRYQRQMIATAPELRAAMQQVLHDNQCSDEMSRYRLLKAGLIRQRGTAVTCRCDLYRDYFAQTL